MATNSKAFKIGRNSETGRLETVKQAQAHPKTSQVEHMPKSGNGTAPKKSK